jgi:hypothetical protein
MIGRHDAPAKRFSPATIRKRSKKTAKDIRYLPNDNQIKLERYDQEKELRST